MTDLLAFLNSNPYPGRGIAVGKNRVYYFIMGRSENSRNRIFSLTEDGIRTEAYDRSKLVDPSLIIYRPVRKMGDSLIVTNGDQTDTIHDMRDFRGALATREYERNVAAAAQMNPAVQTFPKYVFMPFTR